MAMHVTARERIPAPLELCWSRFTDIDELLERVQHKKVAIWRSAGAGPAVISSVWQFEVHFAGRDHRGELSVTELEPLRWCRFKGGTDSLGLSLEVRMAALTEDATALDIAVVGTARSFAGRLLLKPLQLVKPAIEARFRERVAWVVAQMMDRP